MRCAGDCNGNGVVTVSELITLVDIALGTADPTTCLAAGASGVGQITIAEIVKAVGNALTGCPASDPFIHGADALRRADVPYRRRRGT